MSFEAFDGVVKEQLPTPLIEKKIKAYEEVLAHFNKAIITLKIDKMMWLKCIMALQVYGGKEVLSAFESLFKSLSESDNSNEVFFTAYSEFVNAMRLDLGIDCDDSKFDVSVFYTALQELNLVK